MAQSIRFYSHTRGPHRCLSNFYPSPFTALGLQWPTVEHFFQALKFNEPARREVVRLAPSPAEAKRLGRASGMRADWDRVRVEVMREALGHKFARHDALRQILLHTGDAHLIEAAPRDYFWGEGADGSGQNMLGRLLVDIREQLRAQSH